ncbi:hypothetical protein E2C01_075820 [Portunus trituberculatus]|uniref:Uncharacterized protein n=1 Tax=Portunus trituberculatus TaxID=210409 RepID=A0A5B7IFY3_PORTR|nr:hypothetical protein [Portunus trituberculatus]
MNSNRSSSTRIQSSTHITHSVDEDKNSFCLASQLPFFNITTTSWRVTETKLAPPPLRPFILPGHAPHTWGRRKLDLAA